MTVMEDKLGKITKAELVLEEGRLGFKFQLTADGWGVNDFKGEWAEWSEYCHWTKEQQQTSLGKILLNIGSVMKDANVTSFSELVGKPIMVTTKGMVLDSWRILTEVI
jgi:hypothetical protein